MATATFSGQYGRNMVLELRAESTGTVYVAENKSDVHVVGYLHTNGYASVWGVTADANITIDGNTATEHPGINIGVNSTQKIFEHTYPVWHNSDGTKTVGVKLSVTINAGGYGSSMVAFDLPLPTIPRASTGNVTATELGQPATITIDRKSSSFKHTLRYDWNGRTGTIASNIDTSYNWTLPLDFASAIPNANSSWGRVFIDTYNGSTKVGTKEATFTANVPASIKPTLGSITLTDSNTTVKNLLGTANTFVQVMSNIQVAFNNASGSYGSTISSYRAEIVGKNQSTNSNNGRLGIMNFNGTVTIRASITDSRGRTSNTVDVRANVINYFTPQLSFSARRSGSTSTTVTVTRNARIAPLTVGGSQKNRMTISFKYKEHSATSYTTDTGSASGTWTTISELVNSSANLGASFSVLKSYDLIGVISDNFTSYEYKISLGTESYPLAIRPDRVGFGKTPEQVNIVDSAFKYYYNGDPIQHHQVSTDDGNALFLTAGTDLDTIVDTGFYNVSTPLHAPTGSGAHDWKYIRVSKHSNNNGHVLQEAIDFNGNVSAFRVQQNYKWFEWQYYAVQNKVAEFTAVNQTKVYSQIIAMPFSNTATVSRIGNQVQFTWNRVASNFSVDYEYTQMRETVPAGYRPVSEAHMPLSGNVSNTVGDHAVVHLGIDGAVRLTVAAQGNRVWSGTITYLTSDPFPS